MSYSIQHYEQVRDLLTEAGYIVENADDIEEWAGSDETGFEITLLANDGELLLADYIEVKGRTKIFSHVVQLAQEAAIEKFKHTISKYNP